MSDLAAVVERVTILRGRAIETGEDAYLDAIALNLHGFYTGVELALEAIAREVDGSVPAGPNWHRDLLAQLAGEITGIRPAVLGEPTVSCLDAYRGFRHVVRNVYTYNLDAERVLELAAGAADCFARVTADLEDFDRFLEGFADLP